MTCFVLFYCFVSLSFSSYKQNIRIKFSKKLREGSPGKPIRLVNKTTLSLLLSHWQITYHFNPLEVTSKSGV